MNISSSLKQYSLSRSMWVYTQIYTLFFPLALFYTLSFDSFILFLAAPTCHAALKPVGISDLKRPFLSLPPSFFHILAINCCILTTHSRTSLLKGFLLLPRNSPIICRLRPFLCSRKCATPMGVSGMKPREMRNWRPLSGFLFKKKKIYFLIILNCTGHFIFSITKKSAG